MKMKWSWKIKIQSVMKMKLSWKMKMQSAMKMKSSWKIQMQLIMEMKLSCTKMQKYLESSVIYNIIDLKISMSPITSCWIYKRW